MYPVARLLLVPSLRCARPLVLLAYQRPPRQFRSFSATPRPAASELPPSFLAAFQKTTVFQKLAGQPSALKAIEKFLAVLQTTGVDLSSGQRPSTMQMIKLASNSEFREAAKAVADEMNQAGIDLKSKEVMDELMSLPKIGK